MPYWRLALFEGMIIRGIVSVEEIKISVAPDIRCTRTMR